ncbi:alpha/beta fold hydrolase [Alicyclobacillus fastidiosus]|uniref:Alpha/beta hydrolase n=1 Tax=Alicyclobacillus fastidiosus TaxID=392011 RepID=A0ABV5A9P6_9BACL|nr:alpha/beta hydrolase [Alicyclobacillus fastidiosus]WEH10923.1 alpha/beta hydrolase [Alicyclobacillus fastidiosus]
MTEQRKRLVTLPDGRDVEVVEAGEENRPAILVHNGTPSAAGLIQEHVEDAVARGLRIVSYGRPGYGQSTRQPGRSVASAAKDTLDLADALGIERFATWGISGGGPHALACAALLGHRVVAAASLAGVAPIDAEGLAFLAGMGEDNVEEFTAAIQGEDALRAYLEPHVPALLGQEPKAMAEHMRTLLSGPDVAVFRGAFSEQVAKIMQDSLTSGIYGWLDDDLAFVKPWGFSLSSIQVPVQIWQGEQDLMVPFSHGEWLAHNVPDADVRLSSDDGHLTVWVNRVPEVHAWLASHF